MPATVAAGAGIPIAVPQTYTYEVYNGDSPNTVEERAIPGVTQGGLDAYLVVVDPKVNSKVVITDYAYQAIGGSDGLGGGSAKLHSVRAGDTLQGIASGYFGSSAYWYLIADANGLDGTEELKEGTRLIIPGTITNAVNDKGTFKVYDEQAIIGTDSPTVKVKQKSSSGGFFSSIIKILIVIIVIVVAVYVASFAAGMMSAAMGTSSAALAGTGFLGAAGVGGAFATTAGLATAGVSAGLAGLAATAVVAAGAGYFAGLATSFATQGLAIMAGLQEGFDWKAMRDMGSSMAATAFVGAAGGWATNTYGADSLGEGLVKAGAQLARQQAEDGEITNVSGLLVTMAPGIANAKWGAISDVAAKIKENANIVGAGLAVVEASIRGDDQTLNWVNFAAAAASTATGNGGAYYGANGFNWNRIAIETVVNAGLGLAVADRFGEDAGLNFFGSAMGQTLVSGINAKADWEGQFNQLTNAGLPEDLARELADDPKKLKQFMDVQAKRAEADPAARREAALAKALSDPNAVVRDDQGNIVSGRAVTPEEEAGYRTVRTGGMATGRSSEEGGTYFGFGSMTADAAFGPIPAPDQMGGADFAAMAAMSDADRAYTIQSGDTLSEIAAKAGVSADYLAAVNGISNPNLIYAGNPLNGFTDEQLEMLADGRVGAVNTPSVAADYLDAELDAVSAVFDRINNPSVMRREGTGFMVSGENGLEVSYLAPADNPNFRPPVSAALDQRPLPEMRAWDGKRPEQPRYGLDPVRAGTWHYQQSLSLQEGLMLEGGNVVASSALALTGSAARRLFSYEVSAAGKVFTEGATYEGTLYRHICLVKREFPFGSVR